MSNANNHKNECPVPAGTLLIIGGKENKGESSAEDDVPKDNFIPLEILKDFIGLIKKKNPVIELITTASSDGKSSFREYNKLFKQLDISHIGHIHHDTRNEALADDLADRVKKADALFFAGGDQLKLTVIYGGTPLLTQMKERYIYNDVVIAGTSAGATALGRWMIYAGNKEVEQTGGSIKVAVGLEFVKDVCVDTHFVSRGRFVRMAQVVVTNPTCIGMGVEEDTAVIVRNGTEAEVVGTGTVVVIDGFHISEANVLEFADEKSISIKDLKVHILSRGDKYKIPLANPPHQ